MSNKCQSCGLPIETGIYCAHCVDKDGNLQDFETRFEKMVQWQIRRGSSRAEAEKETINYMASMPAWAEHKEIKARAGG